MKNIITYIIGGIICLCSYSTANAQSKPKRDTSKDRSVIVAQRQKQEAKKNAEIAEKKRREAYLANSRRRRVSTPKPASYLTVNNLQSVNRQYTSKRNQETFKIDTDGKAWTVTYQPIWCTIYHNEHAIEVTCNENLSRLERKDYINIKSDDKEAQIIISQSGVPYKVYANFMEANITHNVKSNGTQGKYSMAVNARVHIQGADPGDKCMVVLNFYDENRRIIRTNNSLYYTSQYDNYLIATKEIEISSVEGIYDVTVYVPNNALLLPEKKNKLNCHLALYFSPLGKNIDGATYSM